MSKKSGWHATGLSDKVIGVARVRATENEKASFLGLASFNSPLKQFFFLDQDWENSTAFYNEHHSHEGA